jgi:hypothetical protein
LLVGVVVERLVAAVVVLVATERVQAMLLLRVQITRLL